MLVVADMAPLSSIQQNSLKMQSRRPKSASYANDLIQTGVECRVLSMPHTHTHRVLTFG